MSPEPQASPRAHDVRERPLSAAEARVLATLMEKARTVPDSYPLTLNTLVIGCNQKSSREPVMQLPDAAVIEAVGALRELNLVFETSGSRVTRYEHNFQRAIGVPQQSAVLLGLLMLRGPQTAGELRLNTERWYKFLDIASVDALLPCLGTGYDSAKAGAVQFTRSLAVDLAPYKIRVNAISPGVVLVPTLDKMHSGEIQHFWPSPPSVSGLMGPLMQQRSSNVPLGRKGKPDDIGHAVHFLVSGAASYITGQNLFVDGGWTLI